MTRASQRTRTQQIRAKKSLRVSPWFHFFGLLRPYFRDRSLD
jgi:hypothetical protein